jgi:hypothetical protein
MTHPLEKTPLKNRTALSHLQTIKRAKEIVNSWPEWKRERIVFRDKSARGKTGSQEIPVDELPPQKRTA